MTDQNKPNKTIMLVEDELPFRQIYRDALAGYYDFNIVEAEDGDEALAMLEQGLPDLILLDLIMPNKDGFDVLSKLKNDPRYKNIPIIVYSVIAEKPQIDKAMQLGADDFTIKGITPASEVVNKVRRLLDPKAATGEPKTE